MSVSKINEHLFRSQLHRAHNKTEQNPIRFIIDYGPRQPSFRINQHDQINDVRGYHSRTSFALHDEKISSPKGFTERISGNPSSACQAIPYPLG